MIIHKNFKKHLKIILQKRFSYFNSKNLSDLLIGNVIEICYKNYDGAKYRIQSYRGIIISKQKKNFNKSFTIRRFVEGISVEQIFIYNSPNIITLKKKHSYKICKAKLYFLRKSLSKSIKLKSK